MQVRVIENYRKLFFLCCALIVLQNIVEGLIEKENDCPKLAPNMDKLTQAEFSSKLTDPCRYDKLIKPTTAEPLPVYVQLDLSHIESLDQVQFKAYMLVQYRYNDKRLRFEHLSPKRSRIIGEDLLRDKIWIPHLFIRNDRTTSVMGIDAKDVLVSISPKGDVLYSYRLIATFYCWMNLKKFPFDTQSCDLRWNSWKYNSSNLILQWEQEHPVVVAANLHLTEFILTGITTSAEQVEPPFPDNEDSSFTELVLRLGLAREVGYYILDYFVPSILLVCTSWVTFWLQADASPARTALGTSTMLAFITLNGSLKKNLPKVSYIKASEIWFLACACFIFGSMAEFAFVNVIWRRRKEVQLRKQSTKHILFGAITPRIARKQVRKADSLGSLYKPYSCSTINMDRDQNYLTVQSLSALKMPPTATSSDDVESCASAPVAEGTNHRAQPSWHTMSPREISNWIDRKSRICFPAAFLIFNILYWTFVYFL